MNVVITHPGQIAGDLRTLCKILCVAIGEPLINSAGAAAAHPGQIAEAHPGQIVGAHPGQIGCIDPELRCRIIFDWWSISNPEMAEAQAYAGDVPPDVEKGAAGVAG